MKNDLKRVKGKKLNAAKSLRFHLKERDRLQGLQETNPYETQHIFLGTLTVQSIRSYPVQGIKGFTRHLLRLKSIYTFYRIHYIRIRIGILYFIGIMWENEIILYTINLISDQVVD